MSEIRFIHEVHPQSAIAGWDIAEAQWAHPKGPHPNALDVPHWDRGSRNKSTDTHLNRGTWLTFRRQYGVKVTSVRERHRSRPQAGDHWWLGPAQNCRMVHNLLGICFNG
ncbi:hypothetical protein C8R45DRAFT_927181 [Mycena sanguinolenta]|nr:hypothetical protein C8R45DRAFT_927181 [Mycena sanguinolenta]